MRITTIGSTFSGANKKTNFKGELIVLKKLSETTPVIAEKANKNFNNEIGWMNWISLKIKHYSKKSRNKTNNTKDLFQSMGETFNSKDNKNFLDTLFRESPEEALAYKKKFYQVLNQFQSAGVSAKDCNDLKGGLDFIEEVSRYSPTEDLNLKKFSKDI